MGVDEIELGGEKPEGKSVELSEAMNFTKGHRSIRPREDNHVLVCVDTQSLS